MKEKLLPCPFCGSEIKQLSGDKTKYSIWVTIECKNSSCKVSQTTFTDGQDISITINKATLKWNTRQPELILQEVEKIVQICGNYIESYRKENKSDWVKGARFAIGYTLIDLEAKGGEG